MPTTCDTLAPPPPSVALKLTTCSAAFLAPVLTSFPLLWMQTRDSGLHPPAPTLYQALVLVLYVPAARLTPSPAAYTVRRPLPHQATQSCRTTRCSTPKRAPSLLWGHTTKTQSQMERPQRRQRRRNRMHPSTRTHCPLHCPAFSGRSGRVVMSHLKKKRERWIVKWSFQGDRDLIAV